MARRRRVEPFPPPRNRPKLITLGARAWWRVHSGGYGATQFNASDRGDARFSPLHRPDGTIIPVLYAASTLAGALMETVFHDVPSPPDDYILDIEALREQNLVVSRIRPKRRLKVVDLSTKGLKPLGLQRTELIDTPVSAYSRTRQWAEWLHRGTAATGLVWTSRQDDGAQAIALFGDRVSETALNIELDRKSLCEDEHLDALLVLAEHIGINRFFGL